MPLELRYNDTTLRIPRGIKKEEQALKYTHEYTFYGFDSIFDNTKRNTDVANDIIKNLLKNRRRKKKQEMIYHLCVL